MPVVELGEIANQVRPSRNFSSLSVRTCLLVAWCAAVLLVFRGLFEDFIRHSFEEHSSQWILPLCVVYLIYSSRKEIFSSTEYALSPIALFAPLAFGTLLLKRFAQPANSELLGLLSVLLLIVGGFWCCYGNSATRRAAAPLCLLGLMLPIPTKIADESVSLLQAGSTTLSAALFSVLGVPVYREGFFLTVPGITIEVAKECSGINSTIALFITMLFVGFQTLKTTSSRVALLLLSIPLSVLKNSIRITTLTILALRVDRGFLTGRLHHQGGFVFYLISLLLMYPVWKFLRKAESSHQALHSSSSLVPGIEPHGHIV